ncbi:MAG: hypothetical protein JWL58_3927 [Streptosporangiaceae bacterium]|nr:hypothetical protein [Streptosporangiaceae bacterium]
MTRPEDLAGFLADRATRWQVPENCAFVEEIPKTTVGKFDKKPVRARLRAVELTVQRLVRESQG